MSDLPHTGSSPGRKSGSAALWVLLLLVVLLGFVAYLWFVPVSSSPGSGPSPVIHTPAESRQPRATQPRIGPELAPEERIEAAPDQPAAGPLRSDDSDRFRGRGSLRGSVDTSVGDDFPATWTLVLEPSKALMGSESAVTQRLEFSAEERDFEVPDLPLAGYAVRAEAPGYNGLPVHVLLEKTSSSAYVMLQLDPAGFLTGQLTDSAGEPLEGIEVWLFQGAETALARSGSGGRKTEPLADGPSRFGRMLEGPPSLLFGSRLAPMLEPLELQFRAPSLPVPSPPFPPLASLDVMIV
ncbi:MAG: hypothetical protein H8D72_00985, partial [Planctomycetes bacterium]|nr:hypothetical protein [Planctomycetota bacterium]